MYSNFFLWVDITGLLEVGKFTDINIFNINLLKCEIDEWKNLPSMQTFYKGKKIK